MSKKVYKIICEWDTDLTNELFVSKEAAMKALLEFDWVDLVEDTLPNLMNDGLISVEEVIVNE